MAALKNNGLLSLDNNNDNKDGKTNWSQKKNLRENENRNGINGDGKKKKKKEEDEKSRKILWL